MKDVVMNYKNALSYMQIAKVWGENSHAKRAKVGCIIVKDNMIISDGYNGTPSGFSNQCEEMVKGKSVTKKSVLHAESNAICKLAKSNQSSMDAQLYTTMAPCLDCSKLIIQSGIKVVHYIDKYSNEDGLDLLKKADIHIVHCK